jgi:hypothetical protein
MNKAFNFEDEVDLMAENPPIGKESSIIIWGGVFKEERFKDFMSAWSFADMYVIQEHAHKIDFQLADADSIVNQNPELLERMEIFGASGNLSLRRNGDQFLWHFISDDGQARQETLNKFAVANLEVKKFWDENTEHKLYRRDESALLWGDYDTNFNRWHDDRVGWANLDYPTGQRKRMQIDYTVFTDYGQTAFVWWKELKQHG